VKRFVSFDRTGSGAVPRGPSFAVIAAASSTHVELSERVWESARMNRHEADGGVHRTVAKKIDIPPLIQTVRYIGYTIREPS
jgi:hypothetical protein